MNTRSNHSILTLIVSGAFVSSHLVFSPVSEAGTKDPLFPGAVRPSLDYPSEKDGYLKVYSATDRFDDGDVPYYPHSSYSIYTTDGKFFKRVENHIAFSDEIPEIVTLPVGYYTIDVRSEQDGYVRVHVLIEANRRTIVNLDRADTHRQARVARSKQSQQLPD